jgi:anti-anti-sigma factor
MSIANALEVSVGRSSSGALLVQPRGPLTIGTLFAFQEVVSTGGEHASTPMILDLSWVSEMDSAGLGGLVILAACRDAEFGITGLPKRFKGLFAATQADRILRCFDSVTAAESALASRRIDYCLTAAST